MRFLFGAILVALAVLYLLTALALAASEQLSHPIRIAGALTALLALGLVLLAE